jgi:aminoglycoside 6'-N-acetyltransferase I
MKVRQVNLNDRNEWARIRNSLWNSALKEHLEEIDQYFCHNSTNIVNVFVLERNNGKLGGFIELNIRNYAEGSELGAIPYIEGLYVDSDIRNSGYGRQLIAVAEAWAIENGFNELASDTKLENLTGIAAHKALGFQEVERIVCFIKKLP